MAPSHPERLQKHHLRPTLRGPHRYDGDDERQAQQAGRSSTNLAAQASAQTLREASRSRPGSREGTTKNSPPQSPGIAAHLPPLEIAQSRPVQDGARSLGTPAVPSPLNPTTSNSSSESRKNSDDSGASLTRPPSPQRHGEAFAVGTDDSIPSGAQTPSQPLLRHPDTSHAESLSTPSQSTPKSVRDLGSDYTRYFNPFATRPNSANTSQQDLSTAPLPSHKPSTHLGVSSTDLTKRLSNPFKDDRRISASLVSASEENIVAGPPMPETRSDEKEKKSIVTAVAVTRATTPTFIHNADPEKMPFFPYLDDRLAAPCAFPLYVDQQEDDDDIHMPQWDDDRRYRPTLKDRFSKENLINTVGMIFLLLGIFTIFVILPVVSFTGTSLIPYTYETPLDQMPGYGDESAAWAHVNDRDYPLIKNVRTGLVDPDTPDSAMTKKGVDGDDLVLVFSDEFNAQNRTFYPGDDPYWFAPDIWYGATQDLEWYDPDAANTGDGTLQLQLDAFNNHGLGYRSGMLNSWNQLCFKGGVFEVSISLPGPAGVHGLWPGAWTMGNLGRPGYLATTDGMWPYTYDSCDTGITPNQSMTDGTSFLPGQRLPNCVCDGEDHPSPGTGRGAPEIDIVEVSGDYAGLGIGVATQSYQVAPFDIFYYPNYEFMETPHYDLSFVNTYTGGPYQQAVSTTTTLNNEWYDGKAYQKYSFEYVPGGDKDSFVAWFVGDEEMMRFDARAIGPNGNIQQRLISEEPMSMVLNLGFSHSWVDIDQANLRFPTVMQVDYVRWYQKEGESMVTCDPPGYETTQYIASHPEAYNNPNYTHWADTGYEWPKNTLMHGCEAR